MLCIWNQLELLKRLLYRGMQPAGHVSYAGCITLFSPQLFDREL